MSIDTGPNNGVKVHQLGAEAIYLPFVHRDLAGDFRALVTQRVDGNWLFGGKRQWEFWHPAIVG